MWPPDFFPSKAKHCIDGLRWGTGENLTSLFSLPLKELQVLEGPSWDKY